MTNDSGLYEIVVFNDYGSITGAVATLNVWGMPWVIAQPRSLTVASGTDVNLCATLTNTASLDFRTRWWRNSSVSGWTTNQHYACTNLPNVQTNLAGTWKLEMNSPATRITCTLPFISSNAYLAVVIPPTNLIVAPRGTATFHAKAAGPTPLRYQWQFNGSNLLDNERISGTTNLTLIISNVQCSDAGTYELVVANHDAEPASFPARLDVQSLTVQLVSCIDPPFQRCLEICWCDGEINPQLEWTEDLSLPTPWQLWTGTIPPGPGWKCIRIPVTGKMKFFRLKAQ